MTCQTDSDCEVPCLRPPGGAAPRRPGAARTALAGIVSALLLAACAWSAAWLPGTARAGEAAAGMSIRELRTLEAREAQGRSYASYYLVGVLEGLREAAEATRRTGGRPAFCVQGRRLEPAMARGLYEAELRRHADLYEADMPVPLVLAAALQSSFRCKE